MFILILTGTPFNRVNMYDELIELASRSKHSQALNELDNNVLSQPCIGCGQPHLVGHCPLKHAGVEHCPLCGVAHYGNGRTCAHLNSVEQCRYMLEVRAFWSLILSFVLFHEHKTCLKAFRCTIPVLLLDSCLDWKC